MRTVILIGSWSRADAINATWMNVEHVNVYALIIGIAIIMDLFEFVHKIYRD